MKNVILIITTMALVSCSSVRVPSNINKAKRIIDKNKRQTEAIVSFHGLSSPFVIDTTISVVSPSIRRSTSFVNNLEKDLIRSLNSELVFLDPGEKEVIKDIVLESVRNNRVNYAYDDEFIEIVIVGHPDSVVVSYNIKERIIESDFSYEGQIIDTKRNWYDEPVLRLLLFIVILFLLYNIILNKSKNE